MAKISPIEFFIKSNNTNGNKRFVFPCFVYSDGTFKALIEDEHVQDCVKRDFGANKLKKGDLFLDTRKEKFMVCHDNLALLTVYLKELMEKDLESTVTEEILIGYKLGISARFWRYPDGTLSGDWQEAGSDGDWINIGEKDYVAKPVAFSVGAVCLKRTTYTNREGSSVKHSTISQPFGRGDNPEIGPFGNKLTRWCSGWVQGCDLDSDWKNKGMKLLPYTEKTAEFFYNLVYGTALLCDKVNSFLADEVKLGNAIAEGNLPRLMDGYKEGSETW